MGTAHILLATLLISFFGVRGNVFSLERAFPSRHPIRLDELRARDLSRHAHVFKTVVSGLINVTVVYEDYYGHPQHIGVYVTKVKIGSSPREFYVLLDTGSDLFWVSCSSCSNCPRFTDLGVSSHFFLLCIPHCLLSIWQSYFQTFNNRFSFYDIVNSSTGGVLPCSHAMCGKCSRQSHRCEYDMTYSGGDRITSFLVSDVLHLDTIPVRSYVALESSAPIVFGVFSHCLKGDDYGGGILILGDILEPSIVYTPLVPKRPYYAIYLQSIAVNGKILPIDPAAFKVSRGRGTVVDSGTTLAYLIEELYEPFIRAITLASSKHVTPVVSTSGNQCYRTSISNLAEAFPSVSLNFAGGVSMVLKPREYLIDGGYYNGLPSWCMGFLKAHKRLNILGDLLLRDKIVVYDIVGQQLGWANFNCSSPINVSVGIHERQRSDSSLLGGDMKFQHLATGVAALLSLNWLGVSEGEEFEEMEEP
ncbi:hypothetical protein DVH24_035543 [Malus domestica]|uniref:Peptidase A1 domain-containing protein n=1 Tax=Malus domestica TaxID=3750 RepID=A0A498J4R8_MALDO|nr:hypothetical protein DVH24_035543 [Malus domestica]